MTGPSRDELRIALDGKWRHIREMSRKEMVDQGLGLEPGLSIEEARDRTLEQLRLLVDSGIPATGFSVEAGGTGDPGASVTGIEMVAQFDLSLMVKAGVQWGLFGGAVENLGTAKHHEKYVKRPDQPRPARLLRDERDRPRQQRAAPRDDGDLRRGDRGVRGALADACPRARTTSAEPLATPGWRRSSPSSGPAARATACTASWCPSATRPAATCPASPPSDDGYKGGLIGVDNGRLVFDEVRIPRDNLLDRIGQVAPDGTYSSDIESENARFFTMLGTLIRGRISVGGSARSAAEVALSIAVRYAEQRRQFGPDDEEVVIMDYLVHQRRLLPLIARTYAFRFAQNQLVARMDRLQTATDVDPKDQRELESRAAGLKALQTWHAARTIQECREACGGAGYLAENRLSVLRGDIDVFTTFEGDNHVLLQLVAKELLTSYAKEVGGLDPVGMVRFVAATVGDVVKERTAASSLIQRLIDARPGGGEHELLDRGTQLGLFEDREQHVLETAARRLRRAVGKDEKKAFEVFNDAQDHVLRAGQVHIDRIVLEAFTAGIARCDDEEAADLLRDVCSLYALIVLEEDLAWFMGHNRLSGDRAKQVTNEINALLKKLRPHALTLVAGLGVPEESLGSAILVDPASGAPDGAMHAELR